MKKIIIVFISIMIIIFLGILYMDINNDRYINKMKKSIIKNTNIKNVLYINKYDNYYIVKDDINIYVIDNKYYIVVKINNNLVHENKENYDMIYRNDTLMYFNEINKKNVVIYEYYDIYTYKKIDKISLGG